MTSLEKIKQIKIKNEAQWLKIPLVVGVGIGILSTGKMGIIISLKSPDDEIRALIPDSIEGVDLEIQISGILKAQ